MAATRARQELKDRNMKVNSSDLNPTMAAESRKVGSMGSVLPEHPGIFPGTLKVR